MQQVKQHLKQPNQPNKIVEAREALRTLLLEQLEGTKERLRSAEAALAAAQAELVSAKTIATAAEAEFKSYNFPAAPSVQKGKGKPTVAAVSGGKPNGSSPKALNKPSGGKVGRVVISRPVKKTSGPMTVPERVAALMGGNTWTAGELQEALANAGESFKSNNLRSYISTTLNSSLMNVLGADGSELKLNDGKLVKVHVFKAVERGQYRVANEEDIQEEVKKLLGASEVVIGGADKVFAEQGIDVRPALAPQHH